jgi:hypothetical protein
MRCSFWIKRGHVITFEFDAASDPESEAIVLFRHRIIKAERWIGARYEINTPEGTLQGVFTDTTVLRRRTELKCRVCGKSFEVDRGRTYRKCCSRACAGIWKSRSAKVTFKCEQCGVRKSVLKSVFKEGQTRFCSKRCAKVGLRKKVTIWCQICGKSCEVQYYRRKRQKYCSPECAARGRRKVKRPGKEQLQDLIQRQSLQQIGDIYGVSSGAVRFWAVMYGLYIPSCSERAVLRRIKRTSGPYRKR